MIILEHECEKEVELVELKQSIKSLQDHENLLQNYSKDVEILKVQQKEFIKQREEMIQHIQEINECQNKLIKEMVKINVAFTTIKYLMAVFFTVFGGIICFLVTELIKIIH